LDKAFDTADHYKLFYVLIKCSIKQLIGLLSCWFAKCFACVRWFDSNSSWCMARRYFISNSFGFYIDPLIIQLRRLGVGCSEWWILWLSAVCWWYTVNVSYCSLSAGNVTHMW